MYFKHYNNTFNILETKECKKYGEKKRKNEQILKQSHMNQFIRLHKMIKTNIILLFKPL